MVDETGDDSRNGDGGGDAGEDDDDDDDDDNDDDDDDVRDRDHRHHHDELEISRSALLIKLEASPLWLKWYRSSSSYSGVAATVAVVFVVVAQ